MDNNDYDALAPASSATLRAFSHASGTSQQSIWEEHKSLFNQLYVKEKKTLQEVKAIAEKDFGFPRTPLSTYESKFRNELGLKKKLKWFDWIAIHDHISHLGNPKVEVSLDGNLIPPKKVKKEINRNLKKREGRSIPTGASNLPECVEIRPVTQEVTTYDRQIVAISPTMPQSSIADTRLMMSPFPAGIQYRSSLSSSYEIPSNQSVNSSALDPLLVDNCFDSSGMPMEVAESLFLSTAEEATHIITRLPGNFQATYDFLSSRLARNRSVTGVFVLDPEFRKFWPSMLDHLPIMRALIDPAAPHPETQGSDDSWSSDELLFVGIGNTPPSHYLSSAEHHPQSWSVQDIDQGTAPPIDAPLSTSRDVFHAINCVLYLFSNNPDKDEALEYVRDLVAQNISWSTVEAILKIPSYTIQSIWVLLADCAFKLYVRRLFDAVVGPASDSTECLAHHGPKWLTQAAVLGSTMLCRKLMKLGISSNIFVGRSLGIFEHSDPRNPWHDIRPWTTTGLQTLPQWYHQYRSHCTLVSSSDYYIRGPIELLTSPLVEAAVRGHIETVDVLLEGGANFEDRINGCTTVGHLLHSLFQNNVYIDARLQILQNLLELGAKVDVPFYITPRPGSLLDTTEDTIADMVWQTDCPEAIHMVQNYAKLCLGRLTVQGILRAAGNSAEELADILRSFQASTSAERLSVERTALMKAIDKPEVLLNMIKAGFDLHKPKELIYISLGGDRLEYARIESFVPRNIILEKYLALIAEQPFHPFARQILISIPLQTWPMTPPTSGILGVCRTSDSLDLLLQTGVQIQKHFLISAFVQAVREDDHNFMSLLLDLLGDINFDLRTGPIHWNILILAAMAKPFAADKVSVPGLAGDPASIETLDWLVAHGADIPSCVKTLDLIQDLGRSVGFDVQRLEWLLAHNIRPKGKSLCGIFMDYVSLYRPNDIPLDVTSSLFKAPRITGLSLFEPCSAMIDQSGQSVINDFALVYFIKLGAPVEFIQHLCESGIDCDTQANFCGSHTEPLSWHFFKCDHDVGDCKCLTPLQAAISTNRIDVVRYLLEKGANTNGGAHYNALQFACTKYGSFDGDFGAALSAKLEIDKCLLRNGADPSRTEAGSLPALRLAIQNFSYHHKHIGDRWLFIEQHLQLLKVLLDAGVGTDGFDRILGDALRDVPHFVKNDEFLDAVTELLCGYKTDIDKQTFRRVPYGGLLMEACRENDIGRIKTLLDQGVNPNWFESPLKYNPVFNSRDGIPSPSTPSAVLAAQGNIPLLLLLRAAGAELVRYDNSLECAASHGKLDTVAWLLKFEERDRAFARAMMRAHILRRTAVRMLIEEHLKSIGSNLLDNSNWNHQLYQRSENRCAERIMGRDFEDVVFD